jgi:serine protease
MFFSPKGQEAPNNRVRVLVCALSITMSLVACGGGGGGGGGSGGSSSGDSNAAAPTPSAPKPSEPDTGPTTGTPTTVAEPAPDQRASIHLPSGFSGDGENMSLDPLRQNEDNDSVYGAYAVATHSTAVVAGAVTRFDDDRRDFFQAQLSRGTIIRSVASTDTIDISDADMYLYDEHLNLINASLNSTATESLTVPNDGNYYIEIAHHHGDRAKYNLSFDSSSTSNYDHPLTLNGNIIVGEFMVAGSSLLQLHQFGLLGQLQRGHLGPAQLLKIANPAALLASLHSPLTASDDYLRRRQLITDSTQRARYDSIFLARALTQLLGGIVEPNIRLGLSSLETNDSQASQQWSLEQIGVNSAWQTTSGTNNVHVAVIDTGFLLDHRDLKDRFTTGWNYIDDNNDPGATAELRLQHGTHVAGIIAAERNNGFDIAGIAPNIKIIPIKVMRPECLCGSLYDALQGILWAAGLDNSAGTKAEIAAKIINLSIDLPTSQSQFLSNTINAAREAGSVVVWAAGNNRTRLDVPAHHSLKTPGLLITAASGLYGKLANYSNYGNAIDLIAPGGDSQTSNGGLRIRSLSGGLSSTGEWIYNSSNMQGTSQAAPHVAGTLALAASVWPNFSPDAVESLLNAGTLTQDTGIVGPDSHHGNGRIDAAKTVQAANQESSLNSPRTQLNAQPSELNFGGSFQELSLHIEANVAQVAPLSVSFKSEGLTVTATDTDQSGLGEWRIALNRNTLGNDLYQGVVIFKSGERKLYVPVAAYNDSYLVRSTGVSKMLVEFLDPSTQKRLHHLEAELTGPRSFHFDSEGVPAGDYIVRASSDLDNNGRYCEIGEFCGYLEDNPNRISRVQNSGSLNGQDIRLELLR